MYILLQFYFIYLSPNAGVLQVQAKVAKKPFLSADKFTLLIAKTNIVVLLKVLHHTWLDSEGLKHFVLAEASSYRVS